MSVDLGAIKLLGADAVGQPGQRRFRLFAQNAQSSLVLWMEKGQLDGLSVALDHSLALITEGQVLRTEAQVGGPSAPNAMPDDFPPTPTYEFQVGQISLKFDQDDALFLLNAVPLNVIMDADSEPQIVMREERAVSFVFTQQQARLLSGSIISVMAAGRPVCPLCHTPLDGEPHACIKQNGHRQIVQIEDDEDRE